MPPEAERQLTELETIQVIRESLEGQPREGVVLGPGDDAAIFSFSSEDVVLTIDAMFEGIHFSLDTYDMADVGYKAMASSISDIAAMGGQPACALLSFSFGAAPTRSQVRGLMSGAIEMAGEAHCPIVGGDVTRSACGLSVTVAVAGLPNPAQTVRRSGAQPGDVIGVTGTIGDSAAGLFILKSGSDALRSKYPALVEAHLRPRPQITAGQLLAEAGVTALEDVSDGLAMDLTHICHESRTGCEVLAENVPLSEGAVALGREAMIDPLQWAMAGGEDYQLVFTASPGRFDAAVGSLTLHGVRAARVGTIGPLGSGITSVLADGSRNDMEGTGYDHFL